MESEPGITSIEEGSNLSLLDRGLLNTECLYKCPGNPTFWLRLGLNPGMGPPKQSSNPQAIGLILSAFMTPCFRPTSAAPRECTITGVPTAHPKSQFPIRHFPCQKVKLSAGSITGVTSVLFVF